MECVLGSSFSQVHGGVKGSSSHSCRGDHPGDRQWVTVASEGSAGLSFVTPSEGNCGFQLQEQVAALVAPEMEAGHKSWVSPLLRVCLTLRAQF